MTTMTVTQLRERAELTRRARTSEERAEALECELRAIRAMLDEAASELQALRAQQGTTVAAALGRVGILAEALRHYADPTVWDLWGRGGGSRGRMEHFKTLYTPAQDGVLVAEEALRAAGFEV